MPCSRSPGTGGAIPACIAGGNPACLATGLQGEGCAIPACISGGISASLATGLWGGGLVCSQGVSAPGVSAPGGPGQGGSAPGGLVSQHALRQTPPMDGSCRGRYASYWNAFLFLIEVWKTN